MSKYLIVKWTRICPTFVLGLILGLILMIPFSAFFSVTVNFSVKKKKGKYFFFNTVDKISLSGRIDPFCVSSFFFFFGTVQICLTGMYVGCVCSLNAHCADVQSAFTKAIIFSCYDDG